MVLLSLRRRSCGYTKEWGFLQFIIRVNLLAGDLVTKVNGIALEFACANLGSITVTAAANAEGWREYNMAQNGALRGGPVSQNVLVKGVECFLCLF
jgi:hypothetical protein